MDKHGSNGKDMPRCSLLGDHEPLCDRLDTKTALSDIDCLYESKDEKLVLFETKEGHLVAVDASKLV